MVADLLDVLGPEHRQLVVEQALPRRMRRREVLFREGEPAEAVHLLREGQVAIRVSTRDGDEVTIDVRGAGEVVGEMALVTDELQPRSASVVALSEVTTLVLPRPLFARLRSEAPEVDAWLTGLLAERLRQTSARLRDALHETADVRVLRSLLSAADIFGDQRVPLAQHDLAAMAGTTRPTVNRALRAAEERGFVALRRGGVDVVDVEGLRRRAGVGGGWWG